MKYNFDQVISRINTNSAKWDFAEEKFGEKDLLPMWVADMDFASPKPVIDALTERAKHGIYGYSFGLASYFEATINWMKRRHAWIVQKEWIIFSPGIVTALNLLVKAFTRPGDQVIIQTPVYYPFYSAIKNNGCKIVNNPLCYENHTYTMDFEDLEKKLKDPRTKLLILCSPHNPVGRVWTKNELLKLGELCIENNVLVISDEIHSDLIYKGYRHTNFASISEEFAQNSVICTSPSKTFNLAGLQISNIIIPNPKLRELYQSVSNQSGVTRPNLFAIVALEAAYCEGEEWLEQMLEYLEGNLKFLTYYLNENMPNVKIIQPEGTYLVWMDFQEFGFDAKTLERKMLKKGKIALDEGYIFGVEGEGFERINIACPRLLLEEGLKRIRFAVE